MEHSMGALQSFIASYGWVIGLMLVLVCYKLVLRFFGVLVVPDNHIGIVNKKFKIFGTNRNLPEGKIISLNGEAGWQADTLAPGLQYFKWPWQYQIKFEAFKVVDKAYIATVEATDGISLTNKESNPTGRVFGKHVDCDTFQNARMFLSNGGERGTQISIVPPGTYRINTAMFKVADAKIQEVPDNMIGIVTTKDGRPLATGDIAGVEVPNHNMYQNGQGFIDSGGFKGPQVQVLMSGKYLLNPLFATVEYEKLTPVPIAEAGIVISYVGEAGQDVTGAEFQHANMVVKGHKGVWVEPFDPGNYPINPRTHKLELVSTANIVLNWATGKTEAHLLDEHLSTIKLRSSDGFPFPLDVSQIIHIPRNFAPMVIAQFGSVRALVTQVLEPTIGNYFRNAAQSSTVIDFVNNRQQIQQNARQCITEALAKYNVIAVDTLIGDLIPPDELMKPLKDRKVAEQEKLTYQTQELAEQTRKQYQEARALADTQASVVAAQRQVEIAKHTADAAVNTARGQADAKTLVSVADAAVIVNVGNAEAGRTLAIGKAEAAVIELKVHSMSSENFARVEVARALSTSGQKLVPDIIAGGSESNGGTMVEVLLANIVQKQLDAHKNGNATS